MMSPIEAIVRKEWAETLKNKTIVWTFVGLAATFGLMPLALSIGLPALMGQAAFNDPDIATATRLLQQVAPDFTALSPLEQFQVFILRQFLPMFLLLPVMGAMSIATYSIIGEKTSRSLEAVLATPTTTRDLLLAKSLAATIPAVLGTWAVFGLQALLVRLWAGPTVAGYALDTATWTLILVITPLIAFLALGLGVIVSSRATDPRSAQQVAVILILPLIGLIVGQSAGLFLLGLGAVLLAALVMLVLDVLVLLAGVSLFERERILTRWK